MKYLSIFLLLVVPLSLLSQTEGTYTDTYTGMSFVKVKAGTFTMGCTFEQGSDCPANGKPVHEVTLTENYWLSKYEVTQAQWAKVMGKNPSYAYHCPNCPVEHVVWNDIEEFLSRLNAELKKANPKTKASYRLPTEAEWEYAARGGVKGVATRYSGSNTAGDVLWYDQNSENHSHPVGVKAPNELGLYDMGGNVWELCSDRYGAYSAAAVTDPQGPAKGSIRVLRGGGWNSDLGASRIASRIDFEQGKKYIDVGFRVCYSIPGDTPPPADVVRLSVNSPSSIRVEENTPVATTIYTATVAPDVDKPVFSLAGAIKDNKLFNINASTGVVTFKAAPDYENPLDGNGDNIYEFQVTARAGTQTVTKDVIIIVTNVVEKPVFTEVAVSKSVVENSISTGHVSQVGDKTDPVRFSLSAGVWDNDLFSIDVLSGVLTFKRAPDYENPADVDNNNAYQLQITATASASGSTQTASQAVTITVTDVAETPVFTSEAQASVAENATATVYTAAIASGAGTAIFTLPSSTTNDNGLFDITASGLVTFKTAADFENPGDANQDNIYELEIKAEVGIGANKREATEAVKIILTNVLETPVFSSAGPITKSVSENRLAVVHRPALVSGTDRPVFTLSGTGNDKALFAIDASTGAVRFRAAPDYESPSDVDKNNAYQLQITATASASGSTQTASQAVTITVTNELERPQLTSASTAGDVLENTAITTPVYSATIAPGTDAASFSLASGVLDNDDFEIDASTGVVTFKTVPDHELPLDSDRNNIYTLEISATAGTGASALTDTKVVTVRVTNVLEAPVFTSDAGSALEVEENQFDMGYRAQARSSDPVTYSLGASTAAAPNDNGLFGIDATSGVLTFRGSDTYRVLDYENPGGVNKDAADATKRNDYVIVITATAGTSPTTISQTQALTLRVRDVLETPSLAAAVIRRVAENTPTATSVYTPAAVSETTYSLPASATNDNAQFNINSSTGAITFRVVPDYENPRDEGGNNIYEVQLRSAGSGGSVTTQNVTVIVENEVEVPVFSSGAAGSIAENEIVTDYTAAIASGTDAARFSFAPGLGGEDNSLFRIDATSGLITFERAPDYENPGGTNKGNPDKAIANEYKVRIRATAGSAAAPKTATQNVTISVTDVAEAPVFSSPVLIFNMFENATATGYTPAIAVGTDVAVFTLTAGYKDNAKFTINSTGQVVFNTAADFENPGDENTDNIYELEVTATVGSGASAQTATQQVSVIVTNAVETPVFTGSLSATHSVAENSVSVGYNTTLTAPSLLVDANTKDAVTFSLPTAASGYEDNAQFMINAFTGALSFRTAPDFENPSDADANNAYQVRIAATGGTTGAGGSPVTKDVTITVTNELEAPVISSGDSHDVAENITGTGTTTAYTASVSDASKKDAVQFSLAAGVLENGLFTINATTGVVSFNTAPDYEAPGDSDRDNIYVIQVTATAGTSPTKTATKVVRVRVTDVNEAPVFTSAATVSVGERTAGVIYTAAATDDGTAGGDITFALTAGATTFDLSGNQVSFRTPPTFSTTPSENTYTFTLSATDDNATPLSATQTVTVTVTDELDDTAPEITSGNGIASGTGHRATATLSVRERTPVGTVIYRAMANEQVTYSLTEGSSTFALSGNQVRFKTVPTFSTTPGENTKTFTLTARDQANNTATQTVTVTITDETDDTAPTFTSAASATVAENTAVTTVVYTATADETATFSAASGTNDNGLFNIYPSGAVTFKAMPDYETPADANGDNDYILHLHATDAANNQTATHHTVTVTVTDVTNEPDYTDAYTGMAFQKVEKGTFTIGCTSEQVTNHPGDCLVDAIAHSVTLTNDYYLGRYEVTQEEWKRVMVSNPSHFTAAANGGGDNHPVENLNWNDTRAFLKKLNAELKKTDPNTKWVYRLPTEAEWEYAARGGHKATVASPTSGTGATKYAGSNTIGDVAWYSANSSNKTRPVGGKTANELGIYDMNGNVLEWLYDWLGNYTSTAKIDPLGPDSGTNRVLRGGSWRDNLSIFSIHTRLSRIPGTGDFKSGFRVCLSQDNTVPFITSAFAVSVHENTPGTFYTATATDYVSTVTGTALRFSLARGGDNSLFNINATSGAISFKTPPDFETPADANTDNIYVVQFSVADGVGNTANQLLRITVTDRPEDYTDAYTGMAFEKVEKGTFTMGGTSEQGPAEVEGVTGTRSVTLTKDFYIGKYEVTQAQWKKVMGSNPSHFTAANGDNHPVEQVSWNDVQNFLVKLNAELKKTDPGTKLKYRLPTETEWEYAARGGQNATVTRYAGAGSSSIDEVAWYDVNSNSKTHPVGQKNPNELGLYDMSGNVWEWCSDWYSTLASGTSVTDPEGPASGTNRAWRGGSWNHNELTCRAANRRNAAPTHSSYTSGFRVVLEGR